MSGPPTNPIRVVHGVLWCPKCGKSAPLPKGLAPHEIQGARITYNKQGKHETCVALSPPPMPPAGPAMAPVREPPVVAPASNREEDDEADADRTSIGEPRGRCALLSEDDAEVVHAAYSQALEMRDANEMHPLRRFEVLSDMLAKAPTWIAEPALDEFDITARFQVRQALDFPRLSELRPYAIVIDWFTNARKRHGNYTFGQAGRASKKEREAWRGDGPAPWFRMELSLPWWLAAWGIGRERLRLVAHEMGHMGIDEDQHGRPRPVTVGHDIEEHCWIAKEFGPWEYQAQRQFVDSILAYDAEHAVPSPPSAAVEVPALPFSRREFAAGEDR